MHVCSGDVLIHFVLITYDFTVTHKLLYFAYHGYMYTIQFHNIYIHVPLGN